MQYNRTCSIIGQAVLQKMQCYRTCSVTEHAVLQNMQYYRTCSITEEQQENYILELLVCYFQINLKALNPQNPTISMHILHTFP